MKTRLKSPLSKGVAKVPVIMQMEAMECGAASLAMILAYYDKWVPLSTLRELCGISRDGAKMSTIAKTARKLGMEAKGYRYNANEFFAKATFPCIAHWRFTHFVVVCGYRGRYVYINDPGNGHIKIDRQEFEDAFTGVCLQFQPGEGFEPSGSQRSMYSYLKDNLHGAGQTMLFVTLSSFIIALSTLLLPVFSRVFIDRILSGRSPSWTSPMLTLMSVICLIQLFVGIVQAIFQMKLFGTLALRGSYRYMWHLLHMSARFFFQRQPGDLQQNEDSSRVIAETFITNMVPLLVNSFMMVIYAFVMFQSSSWLSLFCLLVVIVNGFFTRYASTRRMNIIRLMKRDMGKLMSTSMAAVSLVETIKASGAENAYFARWSGYQANVNSSSVGFERTNAIMGSLPALMVKLASAFLLCTGVWLVIHGDFTQGMVVAFQGYFTAFMNPAIKMILSGQTIQEMRTDMERIEDIMKYPEYKALQEDDDIQEYHQLKGNIELQDVTFGYSLLEKPLIEKLSFTVEAGSRIAVVGSSGSGKSTILSLVSGLYEPWEGKILFDGKPLKKISKAEFRGSLAVIEQKPVIFKDTIANNIRMWDESIEDFEMILAARDASIHDDIMKRENGYQHMMQEGGTDFSGGQRQRIEIARALAMDPTILIMDEATSALDASTENKVMQNVQDRGITCLIVAHRLSTIRECNKIIVLDQGKIAEQGTHAELMAKEGLYYRLVKNN